MKEEEEAGFGLLQDYLPAKLLEEEEEINAWLYPLEAFISASHWLEKVEEEEEEEEEADFGLLQACLPVDLLEEEEEDNAWLYPLKTFISAGH